MLCFIFRSLRHFEFIFVYYLRERSNSFTCSFLAFSVPFAEEIVFFPLYVLASFALD